MNYYLSIIFTLFRLYSIKCFSKASYFSICGLCRISNSVNIEIGKDATFEIGKGVRILDFSSIIVRRGAKLKIGNGVFMNRNTIINVHMGLIVENGVTIGPNVCIFDHDHDIKNRGAFLSDKIVIKSNAWIGANVVILKGVKIGRNSVIGSGSVVTKDVPDNSIVIQKRESYIKSI